MKEGQKGHRISPFLKSILASWFPVFAEDEDDVKDKKVAPPLSGPEAKMVDAAKHFSSAHKQGSSKYQAIMKEGKKGNRVSSFLRSILAYWFPVFAEDEDDVKNKKVAPPPALSGPEAKMVDAAKHFSSAHKVRLI
ncbi:hypothetical protein CCACVL1_06423 [Corchorus capsularis]|uniref:Uncharacterized protein n=1 Tax=Corchorus capsularis TaxID=210143 RepID=A0A1R3JFN4_COCAP|nr:hypothetical protein CCACVL1_06423 [Corchorus capsularis]